MPKPPKSEKDWYDTLTPDRDVIEALGVKGWWVAGMYTRTEDLNSHYAVIRNDEGLYYGRNYAGTWQSEPEQCPTQAVDKIFKHSEIKHEAIC